MAQRGIGRSAVIVGLLVLAMLIGGRIVGTWHTRQVSQLAKADGRTAAGAMRGAPRAAGPDPVTPSSASPGAPTGVSPTPKTGTDARAGTRPQPPTGARGAGRPADPTFGAKRYTGSAAVALTFDDGPDPTWTPRMLDLLRAQGVKATFCMVGVRVREYPQLVARIVREGHTLCNHSWQHDIKLGEKTLDLIRSDLALTSAEIRKAVPGARIPYYRQPGGLWTANIVKIAKELGMSPLGWSVDPSDWSKPGTQVIISRVMQGTRVGSIVLMHDGGGDRSQTLAACRTLIPWLKQRYKLVPLR